MNNIIICGSGRSGTSMVAGLFANAGYFMGGEVHDPDQSNAKGYFETVTINTINEDILSRAVPRRPRGVLGNLFYRHRVGRRQMWLARVPVNQVVFDLSDDVRCQIQAITAREPFCFKDPRFSYTLPCWQPYLRQPKIIVVFRSPAETASSILRICREQRYLHSLAITRADALQVWELMYSHILNIWKDDGSWLFVHYDQVLTAKGLDRIQQFTHAPIDRDFPARELRSGCCEDDVSLPISKLYRHLCRLAGYKDSRDAARLPITAAGNRL
jgi:hypothetical protein